MGKCNSCHHSTSGFRKNVIVMEASCQMLEVLSFCDWEKAFNTSFNKNKTSNFSNEKKVS